MKLSTELKQKQKVVELFNSMCTDLRVQIADQQDIVAPSGSKPWQAEPASGRCCRRHASVAHTEGRQGTRNTGYWET